MSSIQTKCLCGKTYSVPEATLGKLVACKKCGLEFRIGRAAIPSVEELHRGSLDKWRSA